MDAEVQCGSDEIESQLSHHLQIVLQVKHIKNDMRIAVT